MSIYCYLCCVEAREVFHVKDADSRAYVRTGEKWDAYNDPLSQFLEKHVGKELRYVWEDDNINGENPCYEWSRFQPPEGGWWSHGQFIKEHPARDSSPLE